MEWAALYLVSVLTASMLLMVDIITDKELPEKSTMGILLMALLIPPINMVVGGFSAAAVVVKVARAADRKGG